MEPSIADLGSHIEIVLSVSALCGPDFLEVLERATGRFGLKPILVVCEDPEHRIDVDEAYRIGVDAAKRFPLQPLAIVLRGRPTLEAEYFAELVATNRGARVRYFHDLPSARSWLALQRRGAAADPVA